MFIFQAGGEKANTKYKITIVDAWLRLLYGQMLPEIGLRWESSIKSLGLQRNLQLGKTVHISVAKGSSTCRLTNVFSFGTIPASLVIWLQDTESEIGNR